MSESATLPYASPAQRSSYGRTLLRLLVVTVVCGALFAIIGGVIGLLIGIIVPDYYYAVFRDKTIHAPALGCVMGVGQGGALGVLVGLGLALILTWRETGLRRDPTPLAAVLKRRSTAAHVDL